MTRDVISIFDKYNKQGTKPWDYTTATLDLSYQLGSLAKRIGQLNNTRYRDNLSEEQIKKYIADELADILAETLFIANDLNIDMHQAWDAMLASDKKKINGRT